MPFFHSVKSAFAMELIAAPKWTTLSCTPGGRKKSHGIQSFLKAAGPPPFWASWSRARLCCHDDWPDMKSMLKENTMIKQQLGSHSWRSPSSWFLRRRYDNRNALCKSWMFFPYCNHHLKGGLISGLEAHFYEVLWSDVFATWTLTQCGGQCSPAECLQARAAFRNSFWTCFGHAPNKKKLFFSNHWKTHSLCSCIKKIWYIHDRTTSCHPKGTRPKALYPFLSQSVPTHGSVALLTLGGFVMFSWTSLPKKLSLQQPPNLGAGIGSILSHEHSSAPWSFSGDRIVECA